MTPENAICIFNMFFIIIFRVFREVLNISNFGVYVFFEILSIDLFPIYTYRVQFEGDDKL